jgi:uncharacterized protein YgiM (DUF1202 family)
MKSFKAFFVLFVAALLIAASFASADAAAKKKDLSEAVVGKFIDEETSAALRKDFSDDEMEVSIEFLADGTAVAIGLENRLEGEYTVETYTFGDDMGLVTVDWPEYMADGSMQEASQEQYAYDWTKDAVWKLDGEELFQLFTRVKPAPEFSWSKADKNGYSKPTPAITGTVSGDSVRVRAEPNTKGKEIVKFNKGKKVSILRRYKSETENFPWYEVKADGKTGWMYGEFVRVDAKER